MISGVHADCVRQVSKTQRFMSDAFVTFSVFITAASDVFHSRMKGRAAVCHTSGAEAQPGVDAVTAALFKAFTSETLRGSGLKL